MPIGIFYKEKDLFSNHRFLVEPGDTFYIFSDGYADQFGGDKGRKFMYRRFKEHILELNNLPMVDQKDKLEETFYDWKGGYRQIDDILVIGFKI
jgi:serine phosphatase RsbU (regulator of sigma subunit)